MPRVLVVSLSAACSNLIRYKFSHCTHSLQNSDMPLFQDHPIRSAVCVAIAIALGHMLTKLLTSLYAFHLTQTSVAILGISGLMFLIAMNHRRGEGQHNLMTQMQEEMVLIVGFGLLWIVVSLGWRAITGRGIESGSSVLGRSDISSRGGGDERLHSCSDNDILCIIEEYQYY
ncbi:hypothetical protein J3R30DRAFT_2858897 [Lentinula aciculospora]|uniref:Uncharacterized protein n=1 Tax=Lentinula aciculospora TaxID=153920 RepID=A0A9W9ABF1_9AGAR|nr:hypothetical protein J3R30DRAFT_2858897 [Lentinula aciculospora]